MYFPRRGRVRSFFLALCENRSTCLNSLPSYSILAIRKPRKNYSYRYTLCTFCAEERILRTHLLCVHRARGYTFKGQKRTILASNQESNFPTTKDGVSALEYTRVCMLQILCRYLVCIICMSFDHGNKKREARELVHNIFYDSRFSGHKDLWTSSEHDVIFARFGRIFLFSFAHAQNPCAHDSCTF